MFCDKTKKVEKLLKNISATPSLKTIVVVEPVILELTLQAEQSDIELVALDDLLVSHVTSVARHYSTIQ